MKETMNLTFAWQLTILISLERTLQSVPLSEISVGKMVIEVMKNPLFGVLTTVYCTKEKKLAQLKIGILQAYFYGKSDK